MFTKKQNLKDYSQNVVGPQTTIQGNIFFSGVLMVNGFVNGDIKASREDQPSHVIIGTEGVVKGDVIASSIEVAGRVEGNIHAADLVEMRKSAQVIGDCFYNELMMEPGSYFEGSFKPQYSPSTEKHLRLEAESADLLPSDPKRLKKKG